MIKAKANSKGVKKPGKKPANKVVAFIDKPMDYTKVIKPTKKGK